MYLSTINLEGNWSVCLRSTESNVESIYFLSLGVNLLQLSKCCRLRRKLIRPFYKTVSLTLASTGTRYCDQS